MEEFQWHCTRTMQDIMWCLWWRSLCSFVGAVVAPVPSPGSRICLGGRVAEGAKRVMAQGGSISQRASRKLPQGNLGGKPPYGQVAAARVGGDRPLPPSYPPTPPGGGGEALGPLLPQSNLGQEWAAVAGRHGDSCRKSVCLGSSPMPI